MSSPRRAPRLYVVALVAILCLVYTVSQFLRSSTGVIAPDLMRDLAIGPEVLGVLSGAFFISFALMQIPIGIFLDRYGARLTMIGSVGIAVVGCLAFAAARGETGLTAARILMGIGCSAMLMGPLMVYRRWFPAERFAALTGFQIAVGSLGGLMATTPLAFATETVGWRASFVAVAIFTGFLAVLMGAIVRDAPAGHAALVRSRETFAGSFKGLGEVVRHPAVPPLFAMISTGYASFATVQALWAAPYLADVHGLDLGRRGHVLLVLMGAQVIGLLVWGQAERLFGSVKRPIMAGAVLSAAVLVALAAIDAPPLWLVTVLFAVFGLNAGYTPLLLAHGRMLFPDRLAGRGITLLNFGNMAGVFLLQVSTGLLIGQLARAGFAAGLSYRMTFGFLALVLLGAVAYYATIADTNARAVADGD